MLRVERQAVDKALREGRIPGFRDPVTKRLWVYNSYLDEVASTDKHGELEARLAALEKQVADLGEVVERSTSDVRDAEVTTLRAKVVSVTEANLKLITAAGLRDEADERLKEAAELERQANAKRVIALDAARAAERALREALSQEQLPGSPEGLT